MFSLDGQVAIITGEPKELEKEYARSSVKQGLQ